MNKKRLLLKLLLIVIGGVAVLLLSSCFTTLRILSCKRNCQESCNSSSDNDNISGHEEGIYYSLSNSGDFYWVEEVGYKETDVKIPETYDGLPVMKIRSGAFTHYRYGSGCGGDYSFGMNLTSLTLPKTIVAIESGVFAGYPEHYRAVDPYYREGAICEKLIFEGTVADWCSIEFGSSPFTGVTEFYIGDEKVTDLVVPDGVTKINENAFAYYSGLNSLTLPESLTQIESYAFYYSSVQKITFSCKDLKIGELAFSSCLGLEAIDFTGENLVLGYGVFSTCESLKEVEWNNVEITRIPQSAFSYCYGLESFVIPASVEAIESGAFEDCRNIEEVFNLSKLEVSVRSSANGGVALYAAVVHTAEGDDSKIVTDGDYKFVISGEKTTLYKYTGDSTVLFLPELEGGYDIQSNAFMENAAITTVSIPACVTAIGNNAFYACENLQIVLGCEGVSSVGARAFNRCLKLQSITLGNVEEVGDYSFSNCIALKTLTLPETLKKIGSGAFNGCEGLTSIAIPISVTEIGRGAFTGCSAEITYAGTLEEWAEVTLSDDPYMQVTVSCSDGDWEGKI